MKKLNESVLEIGDIILTTSNKPISTAIKIQTKSDISHAMLYVGSYSVIDSTGNGVHSKNTQRLFYSNSCAIHVLRLSNPISKDKMDVVIDYVRKRVGTEYVKMAELRQMLVNTNKKTSNKQFCSRLVANAYSKSGIFLVNDKDYCTPQDILESNLLRLVDNAVKEVSKAEKKAREAIPSTINRMVKTTNYVLNGARKFNKNIQDLNELHQFLMDNPDYDKRISDLYKKSGYLSVWSFDKKKNEWQYDINRMNEICKHPDGKSMVRRYCQITANDYENINRFKNGFYIHKQHYEMSGLETFNLLTILYCQLFMLYNTREKVARNWLNEN